MFEFKDFGSCGHEPRRWQAIADVGVLANMYEKMRCFVVIYNQESVGGDANTGTSRTPAAAGVFLTGIAVS